MPGHFSPESLSGLRSIPLPVSPSNIPLPNSPMSLDSAVKVISTSDLGEIFGLFV